MTGSRGEKEGTSAGSAELEAELTTLCQLCALCCDGTLFGRVPLSPVEVEPARKRHLRVIGSGTGLEQPCGALAPLGSADAQRACSIYDERPLSCRRFVCRLHERHRREGGPLAPRLQAVRRVRALVTELEASGLTREQLAELADRIEEDFTRA